MDIVEEMLFQLPKDWALATVGSKRTATELVIAEGNKTKGRAMPVSTP